MSDSSSKLSNLIAVFQSNFVRGSLDDDERLQFLRHVIESSRGWELEEIESWLPGLLHRDFVGSLPCEIAWKLVGHLDGQTAARCLQVCRRWYEVISSCQSIWLKQCVCLGINVDRFNAYNGMEAGPVDWRGILTKHHRRVDMLAAHGLQPTWCLLGHKSRITVLRCHGNTLVSASDDRSLRVWDLSSGQCVKVIQAACCSDLQYDTNVIVASFHSSSAAAWSMQSGDQIQTYKGHTSAVLSVDFSYSDDLVVTGSADVTVKLWKLHEGLCLRTLEGHVHWIHKVVLRRAAVDSVGHKVGDLVLLTSDQILLKVWSPDVVDNGSCVKTVSLRDGNRFQGPVMFDGWTITCPFRDKLSLLHMNFSSLQIDRPVQLPSHLAGLIMNVGTSVALVCCGGGYRQQLNIISVPLRKQIKCVSWDSEHLLPEYSWCLSSVSGSDLMWLDGLDGSVLGQQEEGGDSESCDIQLIFADHMLRIHVLRTSVTVNGH